METLVICFPTQTQLDELFPPGRMEADEQAIYEMGLLYDFLRFLGDRMKASRNTDETDLTFGDVWREANPKAVPGLDKRKMAPLLAKLDDAQMLSFVEGAALHELPLPPEVFDHLISSVAKAISAGICTRLVQRRYPFIRFDVTAYVAFSANIKERFITIDHTVGEDCKEKPR